MKLIINKHPHFLKSIYWFKLIGITGSAQLIVQAIGFLSSVLVIRLLPTKEYALYTLANTMLGTMLVLADSGISSGILSQGGKVWQDNKKLGVVLSTGLELRKKFAIASLIVTIPILFYLLRHHDASLLLSFMIVISLIPAFFIALSGSILEIPSKLNQDIVPLQINNVISNAIRLLLSLILLFSFPWAFVAIFTAGISQLWANLNLRKISSKLADWTQSSDPKVKKEIMSFVKRMLPSSIFYCVSGQITIWLISFFGNTTSIAQIGALSRLAVVMSIFATLIHTLILPRFSKLPDIKEHLFKKFYLIQMGLALLGVVLVSFAYLFPSQILFILGEEYSNLTTELVYMIAASCFGLLAGVSFSLFSCRGWVINPLISIPLTLLMIVIGAIILDVSTLVGVLKFTIFVDIFEIIMYYIYFSIKLSSIKINEPRYFY